MSFDELERSLAGLPVRSLDPARETSMLRAVLAAEPQGRWWRRRVPLWQAALACAAMVALALAAPRLESAEGRAGSAAGLSQNAAPPIVVRVDAPILARSSSRANSMKLSEWTPLHTP